MVTTPPADPATPADPTPPPYAPAALFCSNCGRPLDVGAAFCASCGTRVAVRVYEPPRSIDPTVTLGEATYELAPFWPRVGAYFIDYAAWSLAMQPVSLIAFGSSFGPGPFFGPPSNDEFEAILSGIWLSYAIYAVVWFAGLAVLETYGWSPGKAALGFRVLREDGYRPGVVHALARSFWKAVGSIFLLGYLWAAWDSRRQAWHDKGAHTFVVRWPAKYNAPPSGSVAPVAPTLATGPGPWIWAAIWVVVVAGLILVLLSLPLWLPENGDDLRRFFEETLPAPPTPRARP